MFKLFLMVSILIISPFVTAVDQTNPYTLMQEVVNRTFTRLKNDQLLIRKNPDYLRRIVREEIMPYIHVKYAGGLILGGYYSLATSLQREAYFRAMKDYLEKAYAQSLVMYHGQEYQVSSGEGVTDRNVVSVRVTIVDQKRRSSICIDFQCRKNTKTGYWQAYDMIIEGISLIVSKQNEWANILRIKSIDGLTKELVSSAKKPIVLGY